METCEGLGPLGSKEPLRRMTGRQPAHRATNGYAMMGGLRERREIDPPCAGCGAARRIGGVEGPGGPRREARGWRGPRREASEGPDPGRTPKEGSGGPCWCETHVPTPARSMGSTRLGLARAATGGTTDPLRHRRLGMIRVGRGARGAPKRSVPGAGRQNGAPPRGPPPERPCQPWA